MALAEESSISIEEFGSNNFLDFFKPSPVEEELVAHELSKSPPEGLASVPYLLASDPNINECFQTKFVSIGPGYRRYVQDESVDLKKKHARHFVLACRNPARTMYFKLYNEIMQIRDFYDENLTTMYTDEVLTQILFVDGCFLLDFISCFLDNSFEEFGLKVNDIESVLRDIFLLENQLPFQVLKLLGENNFENWPRLIERYIQLIGNCFVLIKGGLKNSNLQIEDSSHLLQLLQIGLRDSYKVEICRHYDYRCYKNEKFNAYNYSVTELREVGIYCKPSLRRGFKCTRFNSYWFYGVLELPSIEIGLFTRGNLLNLIAYEMCLDANDLDIQSYIHFLASILRQPQDVKALREALVLNNQIGSDEDVVQLFKEISAKASLVNSFRHIEIQMQIGRYLDRKGRTKIATWLAEVLSVYFRSPWTTVTVLGGFLVLFATIIQTVLQIISYNKGLE